MNYIRRYLQGKVRLNSKLGFILILLFGIPRFWLVLGASVTGDYKFVSLIFMAMIITSIILLNHEGRKLIGIKKSDRLLWLLWSFLFGLGISTLIFYFGRIIYDLNIEHWYVYISKSYQLPANMDHQVLLVYFIIFSVFGMLFSPFGEELLYRGLIYESFKTSLGHGRASVIDSLAFSITHLAHFGIVYLNEKWHFLIIPSILWMALMFGASQVFHFCKKQTGSIYGAISCHAGFNLAMTYFIFFHI